MGKRLSAAEIFDDVEVDLWGSEYKLRTITKSVADRYEAAQKKAGELTEESSVEDAAATLIAMIDLLLEPATDARPAGELLTEMWEQDKLGLDWLTAFAESIQEEAGARRRPTSATKTAP